MRFYYILIEADGLAIPDGPRGFVANRFVAANDRSEAETLAVTRTLEAWTFGRWKGVSNDLPTVRVIDVEEIGLMRFLGGLRQNKTHVFHDEE